MVDDYDYGMSESQKDFSNVTNAENWDASDSGVYVDTNSMEDTILDVTGVGAVIDLANGDTYNFDERHSERDAKRKALEDGTAPTTNMNDVGNAMGSAALDFLNKKLEAIRLSWTTLKEVPLSGIIEDTAMCALNFGELGKSAAKGAEKILGRLMSVTGSAGPTGNGYANMAINLATEFGSDMMEDPEVQQSIGELKAVQETALAMQDVMDVVDMVQKTWKALEPLMPWVQIACDMAAMFGTGMPKAFDEMNEEQQKIILQLISMTTEVVRKLLSEIKVKLPSIVVDATSDLFSGATKGWGNSTSGQVLQAMFSESYGNSVREELTNRALSRTKIELNGETSNNTNWLGEVNHWISNPLQAVEDIPYVGDYVLDPLEYADNLFRNSFTKNFLAGVSSIASASVYVPPVDQRPQNSQSVDDNTNNENDIPGAVDKGIPPITTPQEIQDLS